MRRLLAPCLLFVAAGGVAGACDSVSDFRGHYAGTITSAAFVRSCFSDHVRASLTFVPKAAVAGSDPSMPSLLTTDDGTFSATPLTPISVITSDDLSELDFPGADRLRNYLLLARPEAGPLAGRDAFVVVSLLDNHRIELRILARTLDGSGECATESDAGPDEPRQYFGVFSLKNGT